MFGNVCGGVKEIALVVIVASFKSWIYKIVEFGTEAIVETKAGVIIIARGNLSSPGKNFLLRSTSFWQIDLVSC